MGERGAGINKSTRLYPLSNKRVFDHVTLGVRFRSGPTHKKLYEIINEYVERVYSKGLKQYDTLTIPIAYNSDTQFGDHRWLIIICEYEGEYGWNITLSNDKGGWEEAKNFHKHNRSSGKGCLNNTLCGRVWDGPLNIDDLSGGSSCGATRSRKKSIKRIKKTRKNKKGKSKRLKRSKRSKQLRKKSIKSRKRR